MLIGYARVSTKEQDTALQLDALQSAGCSRIYQEKASGASRRGRPQLQKLLDRVAAGDALVVYKLDRVARSLLDLLAILRHLDERGASIRSLTEPIDTSSSMGVFVVQVLGAVAQLERSMIVERSIAGQDAARRRGKRIGRPRSLSPADEAALVVEYRTGLVTHATLAAKYSVSVSAVKRAVYRSAKSATYCKRAKV